MAKILSEIAQNKSLQLAPQEETFPETQRLRNQDSSELTEDTQDSSEISHNQSLIGTQIHCLRHKT